MSYRRRLTEMYSQIQEASFNIKPFLDVKDKIRNIDEVTRWVKEKGFNKHGYCQSIAALYNYVDNGRGQGMAAPGHVAYLRGDKVYDPITFSSVPVSRSEWEKKFPKNNVVRLIRL